MKTPGAYFAQENPFNAQGACAKASNETMMNVFRRPDISACVFPSAEHDSCPSRQRVTFLWQFCGIMPFLFNLFSVLALASQPRESNVPPCEDMSTLCNSGVVFGLLGCRAPVAGVAWELRHKRGGCLARNPPTETGRANRCDIKWLSGDCRAGGGRETTAVRAWLGGFRGDSAACDSLSHPRARHPVLWFRQGGSVRSAG